MSQSNIAIDSVRGREQLAGMVDKLDSEIGISWFCTINLKRDLSVHSALSVIRRRFLDPLRSEWLSEDDKNKGRNMLTLVALEYTGRKKGTPLVHLFLGAASAVPDPRKWQKKMSEVLGKTRIQEYNGQKGAGFFIEKNIRKVDNFFLDPVSKGRQFRNAWVDYIDLLHFKCHFHWYAHFTLAEDTRPEVALERLKYYLKKLRNVWLSRKEKKNGTEFIALVAIEYNGRHLNTPHFHVLLGGGKCYADIEEWSVIANKDLGLCKIEPYRHELHADRYITKCLEFGADIQVLKRF